MLNVHETIATCVASEAKRLVCFKLFSFHVNNDGSDETANRVFSCRRFLIQIGFAVALLIRLCGLLASDFNERWKKFMQSCIYEVLMAC